MITKTVITIVLAAVFFSSSAQTWQTKAPNPSNPYDNVGLEHNYGLINCRSREASNAATCASDYTCRRYPQLPCAVLQEAANEAINVVKNDPDNYVPKYLSAEGQNYSSQLISIINQISDLGQVDQIASNIRNLETSILSSKLSDNEQLCLLSACSVARFSLYYWIENLDLPGDPSLMKGWLAKLVKIIAGDVIGALVGAGVGTIESGGNPLGPVAGAIVGAIAGSTTVADAVL